MNDQTPTPTAADLPAGEYAIAEIMGHSTMIGRVSEVERFGTKMLQIEPIWENKLLPAVYVGGASLYRFVPCSREVAFKRQPSARYQLPEAVRATLPPEEPKQIGGYRHHIDDGSDIEELIEEYIGNDAINRPIEDGIEIEEEEEEDDHL